MIIAERISLYEFSELQQAHIVDVSQCCIVNTIFQAKFGEAALDIYIDFVENNFSKYFANFEPENDAIGFVVFHCLHKVIKRLAERWGCRCDLGFRPAFRRPSNREGLDAIEVLVHIER